MRFLYYLPYGLLALFLTESSVIFAQSNERYIIQRNQEVVNDYALTLHQEMPGSMLRNDCSCIQDAVGEILICDNFQSYEPGPVSPQSPLWSLWPGATRDGYVDGNSAGNQFLRLRHQNGTESDVLLDLGNRSSGSYKLSFRLWTWEGYSGYFNIQHDNQLNPPNWAYHVQFINGQGRLHIGSFSQPIAVDTFSYNNNAWNYIEQEIDLDNDLVTLTINNTKVASWQFSLGNSGLEKQLGSIDFYAKEEDNAQFAIDNVCLEAIETSDPTPVLANLTCASRGQMTVDRSELTLSLKGVTVRNTGDGPSTPTRLGYYFSTNTTFTDKDYLVATTEVPALGPGESASSNLFIQLKEAPVPNDTFYFGFIIDYENLVEETNEDDNNDCYWTSPQFIYRITPPSDPNLICAGRGALSFDGSFLDITGLEVQADEVAGVPASEIGIFLSTDENITNADYRLGIIQVDSLPPGTSRSYNFFKDISLLEDLPEGDYILGIIMDPFNTIDESNEDDNRCYWPETPISVYPQAYIANLGCFYPGDLIINESLITLSNMIIENNGGLPSGAFQVAVYLSENANITVNDHLVHEFSISNIDGRDAVTLSPQIDLSTVDLPAGDYYIGTVIDYKNQVEEINEADNRGCSWVDVGDPLITIQGNTVETCACTDPYQAPICEDFESYQTGSASSQSPCLTSHFGGSGQPDEGIISTTEAFSGNQSMSIRENGQANALFLLGEKSAGQYNLEWVMYVPSGKTAYFTLQEQHQLGISKLEVGFDGTGAGQIIDYSTPFSYPQNQWFRIRFLVDLDQNHISVYIDDRMVDREIPFFFTLGSIHFGAIDGRSHYFLDDVHFDPIFNNQPGSQFNPIPDQMAMPPRQVLQVYPNPAREVLNIDLGHFFEKLEHLSLLNELGQQVWYRSGADIEERHQSIPIKEWESGLYFLVVQGTEERAVRKVVVR